jgi:hypothetical protein
MLQKARGWKEIKQVHGGLHSEKQEAESIIGRKKVLACRVGRVPLTYAHDNVHTNPEKLPDVSRLR